jgi:UDP-GlcNAc:undecaprenyl-phosphate GlcNAc-1-phosphate transferase
MGGGLAIWLTTVGLLGLGALVVEVGGQRLPEPLATHASGIISRTGELIALLALASVIMVMGLIDDLRNLDWRLRLGIQVVCASVFAAAVSRVTLFGPFTNAFLGGAVTVVWIVGLTNAFNMLDNMDGLAASVGLIAALLFCGAQVAVGGLFTPAVLLVVVGALAGFLVHNHAPARLFMGDAGSNFLGFLLGALTVVGTYTREGFPPYSVLAPLLVMAVPLYDMTSVVLIRLREGRSPFKGDRRHFSHRLVARGLTPPQAVWTIDLVTLAGGLGALLLHRLDGLGACIVLAQTACLLGVVAILELSSSRSEQGNGQTRGEALGAGETEDGSEAGQGTSAAAGSGTLAG